MEDHREESSQRQPLRGHEKINFHGATSANKRDLERYDKAIRQYPVDVHAEIIPETRFTPDEKPRMHYMPHRELLKGERTTTKLRVVFDASSSAPGIFSLNVGLHKGVNLNPDILELLPTFRSHRTVLSTDMPKPFLQIGIQEKDRRAFRSFSTHAYQVGPHQTIYKSGG